jgi:hypothetical protein
MSQLITTNNICAIKLVPFYLLSTRISFLHVIIKAKELLVGLSVFATNFRLNYPNCHRQVKGNDSKLSPNNGCVLRDIPHEKKARNFPDSSPCAPTQHRPSEFRRPGEVAGPSAAAAEDSFALEKSSAPSFSTDWYPR